MKYDVRGYLEEEEKKKKMLSLQVLLHSSFIKFTDQRI